MENEYFCVFHTDPSSGDIDIECKGEGQEIHFTMMINYYSVPVLFFQLSRLWRGKEVETEMDGYGMAVVYYFKKEEDRMLIKHEIRSSEGDFVHHFNFDFKRFAIALDHGMKELIEQQKALGNYPLPKSVLPDLLEEKNIQEYEAFSALIHG
ncbi:hypothetical protein M3197_12995 [Sporosarcina aquimarina]|uniref:hypothetical protein n=1 Tax=Sporosarcina aquimarina TaxID=114975 RepID=UPI00204195A8|nr:hypothetical protein [Sporosarcina aquimarina]MCM3758380.1 hypothetical protein [Sporosarcina aquimarina]